MRQQAGGAVEIVLRVALCDDLEIPDRRLELAEVNLGDAAPVDRIGVIGSNRDRPVVARSRLRVVALVEIEIRELLEVSDGRIFLRTEGHFYCVGKR